MRKLARVAAVQLEVKMHETLKASPSIDAWAYGKLMYEVLVGEPLIPFDYNMEAFWGVVALLWLIFAIFGPLIIHFTPTRRHSKPPMGRGKRRGPLPRKNLWLKGYLGVHPDPSVRG